MCLKTISAGCIWELLCNFRWCVFNFSCFSWSLSDISLLLCNSGIDTKYIWYY